MFILNSILNAVVLAGGDASRMRGADKPFVKLGGKPLIEHVLERIRPLVQETVVSVNRNPERFAQYGLACIGDEAFPQKSPLLGIHSAMRYYSKSEPEASYLLCVPVDVPVFPAEVVQQLLDLAERSASGISYLQTGDQPQPLFSVWALRTLPLLAAQLEQGGWGAIATLKALGAEVLTWDQTGEADFANINSPDELRALEEALGIADQGF